MSNNSKIEEFQYPFLSGGGEMGQLMREKDWQATSLDDPAHWPQSLRTTLSIILNSKFPMFLFWGPQHICFYNDAYRPSLGNEGKHPDILGLPGVEAWPEIWDIIKPLIDQVLSGSDATWSEDQLIPIYRNGKIEDVYWTFSYSPVNDESGRPAGVFVTCVETTGKVLAMKAVEESLDQLEFAIEATELGTWDLNPLTNKFTSNNRLKYWFGFESEEELELQRALEVIVEKDVQRVTESIKTALNFSSGGQLDTVFTMMHPKTKEERILRAKGRVWFKEDKTAYRFNGTLQDITEQHNAAQEQQKLVTLVEASHEFIALADIDSTIQYVNPAGLKMLGWDSIEGKTILDCIHPEDHELAKKLLPKLQQDGYFSKEIRFINDNTHDKYWIQWNVMVIKDQETGEILGLATVSPNITEHKNAQNELEITLNKMEEQDLQKDLFIGMASHELNTPITSIKGYVQILQSVYKESDDSMLVDTLNIIDNQIFTLTNLIGDLLDVSKIKSGSLVLKMESVDINALIHKSIEEIKFINPEYDIVYSGNDLILDADRDRIGQVMINLLTNAVKYSPNSRKIEVESHIEKDKILVSVRDFGIGISKKDQERIFDRFFRAEGKNESTFPGFGIGLYIASEIIKRHNGEIGVISEHGKGSEFYFTLPRK